MPLNRRDFIANSLAGAGALALGASAEAAKPVRFKSADPFQLVPLGRTGVKVSLIGCGTGMRGGGRQSNQTRMGREKFEALLRYAYDRGCRLFDCADMYGTHPYVGRALKPLPREKYAITSKMWVMQGGIPEQERPDADVLVDRFRKELNTDYIDLVLLHCMYSPKWTDEQKRYMDTMDRLKSKGIIKAHGVSIHSVEALKSCVTTKWVDSVHTRINPFGDSMDSKNPDDVVPVLKQIHDAGKGVVGMKLIGEGRYRDDPAKKDQAIRFVLGLGCVDTMIVGFEKPEEIDDFATRVKSALQSIRASA
ncbi:MAG TPA: aldo/keto reductase [Armatimonadota bacterium]|jgi:predicted aldo/keto reductase-like oxidoreductase